MAGQKSQALTKKANRSIASCRDLTELRRERWFTGGKKRDGTVVKPFDILADAELRDGIAGKILDDNEQGSSLRAELRERPWLLIEMVFTVVNKAGETVPFFLKQEQLDFLRQLEERTDDRPFLILKARQLGFTTLITAVQLCCALCWKNFSGATVANTEDNTKGIFEQKARAALIRLPKRLIPKQTKDSEVEIAFVNGSHWRVQVATENALRSTTLSFVHLSEAAFFRCTLADLQEAIKAACPDGSYIIYESTANGFGEFRDLWEAGTCHNLFYPWWGAPEYRRQDLTVISRACAGDRWLEERVAWLRGIGLDEEQVAWYCDTYEQYLDKRSIRQEYPCTPEEAFVASGYGIFDLDLVNEQMMRASTRKDRVGRFRYRKVARKIAASDGETADLEWSLEDVRWEDDPGGLIRIHEEPRKQRGVDGKTVIGLCPYTLGGDTSGSGEDYTTAKVVDAITGVCAATLRQQFIADDEYAEQCICLAEYYHHALIGIEINFSAEAMRVVTQKYRYDNIYYREQFSRQEQQVTREPGFRTIPQTKSVIIPELVQEFRDNPLIEPDMETLKEFTTFQKLVRPNGYISYEAAGGAHDDLVMACAIAHSIRSQSPRTWMKPDRIPTEYDEINEALTKVFGREEAVDGGGYNQFIDWGDL